MLYLLYWDEEIRWIVDGHFDIKSANVLIDVNNDKIDNEINFCIQMNVRVDCAWEIDFLLIYIIF